MTQAKMSKDAKETLRKMANDRIGDLRNSDTPFFTPIHKHDTNCKECEKIYWDGRESAQVGTNTTETKYVYPWIWIAFLSAMVVWNVTLQFRDIKVESSYEEAQMREELLSLRNENQMLIVQRQAAWMALKMKRPQKAFQILDK